MVGNRMPLESRFWTQWRVFVSGLEKPGEVGGLIKFLIEFSSNSTFIDLSPKPAVKKDHCNIFANQKMTIDICLSPL